MKSKLSLILDTTKKKISAALLCAALTAVIGTGTVLASTPANSMLCKMVNGIKSYSTDSGKTWSAKAPDGVTINENKNITGGILRGSSLKSVTGESLAVKVENGVRSYSTDGGKTWSREIPKGVTVSEDGKKIKVVKIQSATDAN